MSDGNVFWADTPGTQAAFAVNRYQDDVKMRDVAEELGRRLKQSGSADYQPFQADLWVKNPRLTLNSWRLLVGRDQNSQEHRVTVRCDDRSLPARLQLTLSGPIAKMSCTRVEGLSTDFRGQPFPPGGPLPGPLQNLQFAENTILLEPGAGKFPRDRIINGK